MHWSAVYIGLPWRKRGLARDGIACWGLARLVYAECLGLVVPDYAADVPSLEERREVAAVFAGGTRTGPWVAVDPARVAAFDILVFRVAGLDAHVGIAAGGGRMLHITSGQDSALVDYTSGRWAPRLSAVYRHRAMMGEARVEVMNHTDRPVGVQPVPDGRGGRRIDLVMGDHAA